MEAMRISGIELNRVEEQSRIHAATAVERTWWTRDNKFLTKSEADSAQEKGLLAQTPRTDGNYRLIGRLGDEHGEPDLLRPEAIQLLKQVSALWKKQLGEGSQEKQLAVTSLYRGADLQDSLKNGANGYMAVSCQESSHSAGAAFDISLRSYYEGQEGDIRGIQSWNENSEFDFTTLAPLEGILEELKRKEACNYVVEKNIDAGSVPSVLHICVSPNSVSE